MGPVTGRIVVGVDGSPGSDAALGWAASHAPAFSAALVAVHCWTPPLAHPEEELPADERAAVEADFAEVLDAAVRRATAAAPGVAIERVLTRGAPADVLLELAAGAELLVLGSRGMSGHTGAVLGSTSRRVTEAATCPVVLVPTP
jgi:nucleotide-binding universal stress UspA family protein